MQSLVATRSELLDRRRRAVFVSQGRDLLKDTRTALVREFRHHQSELLDGLQQPRCLAIRARQRLDEATAVCGPEPFASFALAAATGIGADMQSRTVAGVDIVDLPHDPVRRNARTRGWASAVTSTHLDTVALAYQEQLEWLLDLCAVELSVRRLATEIAGQAVAVERVASSDAPAEDEPVLMLNRRGWQPFQQLVGFLSWPARGGLDPTGLDGHGTDGARLARPDGR